MADEDWLAALDLLLGGGDTGLGDVQTVAGSDSGGLWYDNQTGQLLTAEQAMQLDPAAFQASLAQFDATLGGATGTFPTTSTGSATTPPDLWDKLLADPTKLFGLILTGGTAAAGLAMAVAGMRSTDGQKLTLPDGRTVTLSPQEQALLDLAVQQAQGQAGVSQTMLPALQEAAQAASPELKQLFQTAVTAANQQMQARAGLTGATGAALTGAQDLFGADLAAARGLTGVAGQGVTNLSDLLRADQPTAAEGLSGEVGRAADQRVLDLINRSGAWMTPEQAQLAGTATAAERNVGDFAAGRRFLSPFTQGLMNLSDVAQAGVTDYLGGRAQVPGTYAQEEQIRQLANQRLIDYLQGKVDANPRLARQIQEERTSLEGRLQQELGPGYATTHPGGLALRDFEQRARESIEQDIRDQLGLAQSIALPRSQFTESVLGNRAGMAGTLALAAPAQAETGELNRARTYSDLSLPRTQFLESNRLANLSALSPIGLGRLAYDQGALEQRFGRASTAAGMTGAGTRSIADIFALNQGGAPTPAGGLATLLGESPGQLALGGLSSLSQVGNLQAGQALSVAQQNQLLDRMRTAGLTQVGGNLFGLASSPFFAALSQSLFPPQKK